MDDDDDDDDDESRGFRAESLWKKKGWRKAGQVMQHVSVLNSTLGTRKSARVSSRNSHADRGGIKEKLQQQRQKLESEKGRKQSMTAKERIAARRKTAAAGSTGLTEMLSSSSMNDKVSFDENEEEGEEEEEEEEVAMKPQMRRKSTKSAGISKRSSVRK